MPIHLAYDYYKSSKSETWGHGLKDGKRLRREAISVSTLAREIHVICQPELRINIQADGTSKSLWFSWNIRHVRKTNLSARVVQPRKINTHTRDNTCTSNSVDNVNEFYRPYEWASLLLETIKRGGGKLCYARLIFNGVKYICLFHLL